MRSGMQPQRIGGRSQNSDRENQENLAPITRDRSPRHHRVSVPYKNLAESRRPVEALERKYLQAFAIRPREPFLRREGKDDHAVCRCGELIFCADARTVPENPPRSTTTYQ